MGMGIPPGARPPPQGMPVRPGAAGLGFGAPGMPPFPPNQQIQAGAPGAPGAAGSPGAMPPFNPMMGPPPGFMPGPGMPPGGMAPNFVRPAVKTTAVFVGGIPAGVSDQVLTGLIQVGRRTGVSPPRPALALTPFTLRPDLRPAAPPQARDRRQRQATGVWLCRIRGPRGRPPLPQVPQRRRAAGHDARGSAKGAQEESRRQGGRKDAVVLGRV